MTEANTSSPGGSRKPSLERSLAKRSEREQARGSKEAYYVASQWQLMWWKFIKHRLATIAGPVLIALYVMAAFADFLSPTLPDTRFTDYKNAPPQLIRFYQQGEGFRTPFVYEIVRKTDPETFRRTFEVDTSKKYRVSFFVRGEPYKLLGLIKTETHLFGSPEGGPLLLLGSDMLGRDLFTRILYGSRLSLSIGLVGVSLTFIFGLLLGGISGYLGGIVDTVIQRTIDLIVCIPTIPLWLALAAALPRNLPVVQMYVGIVVIMSAINWTRLARVVRGQILAVREEAFCEAARLAGASDMRMILRHLLPSMASYIIVSLTLSIPGTILGETALSFLGLGLQPPAVSWGVLLKDAQNIETIAHHPWLLAPTAWIVVTVLMFNFLGDGLRDAADPYK